MAESSYHIETLCFLKSLSKIPALGILAVLILGGCSRADPQTIKHTPPNIEDARAGVPDREKDSPIENKTKDSAPPYDGSASGEEEERRIPKQVAAVPMDFTNFKDRLLGLDDGGLSDLMGSPSLERKEPPATIWQYRATYCVIDIFFYPDGDVNRVDHVEVRGRQSEGIEKTVCFATIIKDKPKATVKEDPRASD